jgi:hypothetical protein
MDLTVFSFSSNLFYSLFQGNADSGLNRLWQKKKVEIRQQEGKGERI